MKLLIHAQLLYSTGKSENEKGKKIIKKHKNQ